MIDLWFIVPYRGWHGLPGDIGRIPLGAVLKDNVLDDAALMRADELIRREFPEMTRRQIRRALEIYFSCKRSLAQGATNFSVDGSGCDL